MRGLSIRAPESRSVPRRWWLACLLQAPGELQFPCCLLQSPEPVVDVHEQEVAERRQRAFGTERDAFGGERQRPIEIPAVQMGLRQIEVADRKLIVDLHSLLEMLDHLRRPAGLPVQLGEVEMRHE